MHQNAEITQTLFFQSLSFYAGISNKFYHKELIYMQIWLMRVRMACKDILCAEFSYWLQEKKKGEHWLKNKQVRWADWHILALEFGWSQKTDIKGEPNFFLQNKYIHKYKYNIS